MNYQQTLKYNFTDIPLPYSSEAVILLGNSETYLYVDDFQTIISELGYSSPTYDELLMLSSSYARTLNNEYEMIGLIYHPYYENTWNNSVLITSTDIDFAYIRSDFSYILVSEINMYNAFAPAFVVYDEFPADYPQFDYYNYVNGFNYYTYSASVRPDYSIIFDYSVLSTNQYTSNQFQSVYNRDNHISYNYTMLVLGGSGSDDGLSISFGTPIHDEYEKGYASGWAHGNTNGYQNGYNDGYNVGVNFGGNGVAQDSATAFSYVGNAFGAVGNIMSLEVLPNVTLGLCFSIPMVFILIMTIFKLVRK